MPGRPNLVGEVYAVRASTLAETLRGRRWGLQLDGVEYDTEFTGEVTQSGNFKVKILRKSEKQPKKT